MARADLNIRPEPDDLIREIAVYVVEAEIDSDVAYDTAHLCLMDSLGCAFLALRYPECVKHLGPISRGTVVPNGTRIPGTRFELDPVQAAFNIGCLIRWLDFNDTWVAAEWGHPSDNLGAILGLADTLSRRRVAEGQEPLLVRDVLEAMIQAYEIQGVLALENALNRVGLDHVLFVKVASTAVAAKMLGGGVDEVINALSNAWVDGGALRTYRHAPNTGPRKSWAAGDATSRAVWLALTAMKGEPSYPSALSAPTWGFQDVLFGGKPLVTRQPFGAYVMTNVLFKPVPAEFHSQAALECAIQLHAQVRDRIDQIDKVHIATHESALRIISKTGPLHNPADRDHCIQYIVAIGLLFGELTADDYEDERAADERIDALRDKIVVEENPQYSHDYLDPMKRSAASDVRILFKDGSETETVVVEYPVGHPRRRDEAAPMLAEKFAANVGTRFPSQRAAQIVDLFKERAKLEAMPVDEFMGVLSMIPAGRKEPHGRDDS